MLVIKTSDISGTNIRVEKGLEGFTEVDAGAAPFTSWRDTRSKCYEGAPESGAPDAATCAHMQLARPPQRRGTYTSASSVCWSKTTSCDLKARYSSTHQRR